MKIFKINIHELPVVKLLYKKADRIILPGLNGASLYDVGKFFISELNDVSLLERADMVTFNFIMAIPSTFLFLFSLIPYLPLTNIQQTILRTLKLVTPNNKIYLTTQGIVNDFMNKQHHSILSFGIILTLYFASNGMVALIKSFDRSLVLYKKRSVVKRRLTAIQLTVMLIAVLVATIAVLIIQNKSLNKWLIIIFHNILAVKVLSIVILVLLIFVAVSLIYTFGPSLTHSFKFVSAGSVFATIAFLIVTFTFFYLVNNFLNYNKVYGSIGTLIAFMVWLWYNTIILLVGYELNVSILLGKLSHEKTLELEE